MTIGYVVTIERIEVVTKKVRGEWTKVGEAEAKGEFSGGVKWIPQFAYAPDVEKDVTEKTVMLTQTVQTLDVAAVIRAVNNL